MNNESNNISSLFKKPMPVDPSMKKPVNAGSAAGQSLTRKTYPHTSNSAPQQTKPQAKSQVKKDFSPIDLSKGQINDSSIYKSDYRNKTRNALKGTLGRSKDRDTVANILWDRRGNGLNSGEVKKELRKAEQKGTLRPDQVRAVKRKMGI